jgi:hypothetical protein
MNMTGRKIAHDRERRGERGEGDLFRAFRDARTRSLPISRVPMDVLQHHDGVVHDDAHGERQAEQGEGVQREAEEVDDAIVPAEDIGIASTTFSVAESEPRNIQHTSAGEQNGQHQLELDLVHRCPR